MYERSYVDTAVAFAMNADFGRTLASLMVRSMMVSVSVVTDAAEWYS